MSRAEFPPNKDDLPPAWSVRQWAEAEQWLESAKEAVPEGETKTLPCGPADVLDDDGTFWYFHLIVTVAPDIEIQSEPLGRLDVKHSQDAFQKGALGIEHHRVQGYSLDASVIWGGSAENGESFYATLATTDAALIENLHKQVAEKIRELVSLEAVKKWLLQEHGEIVKKVTLG